MKTEPSKQEIQVEAYNKGYVEGYNAGRRAGLAEASNALMAYRDTVTGPELPENIFDAPR